MRKPAIAWSDERVTVSRRRMPGCDGLNGGCPLSARNLHRRLQMSAIPTDEPAQDAAPSIDTQHLQQQLHQEVQQPEPTRKRWLPTTTLLLSLTSSLPA